MFADGGNGVSEREWSGEQVDSARLGCGDANDADTMTAALDDGSRDRSFAGGDEAPSSRKFALTNVWWRACDDVTESVEPVIEIVGG